VVAVLQETQDETEIIQLPPARTPARTPVGSAATQSGCLTNTPISSPGPGSLFGGVPLPVRVTLPPKWLHS
jgi:hypothetical protein